LCPTLFVPQPTDRRQGWPFQFSLSIPDLRGRQNDLPTRKSLQAQQCA
jgi:hypothetical protein